MEVVKLRLENFRNYTSQEIVFTDNMNVIYGDNAQGKTNILEAIFLCSTGRSHRTLKDTELIKYGEHFSKVEVIFYRKNIGEMRIGIEISRGGRKSIRVNGIPQRRAGDLMGKLYSVIFSPEDLTVIKQEPQIRRRFLDMFISQIRPAYFFNLQGYIKVLRQRNALLKRLRENGGGVANVRVNHSVTSAVSTAGSLSNTIASWDEELVEYGSKVISERKYFTERLELYARENHRNITGGLENLTLNYVPSINISDKGFKEAFLKCLSESIESDTSRMTTQSGPHKDDLSFLIDGKNARVFASQGQQRTAALALKLAQIDVMTEETGDVPVLLLDDVMSELDDARRLNLISHMKGTQTFITGTYKEAEGQSVNTSYYYVKSGDVNSGVLLK